MMRERLLELPNVTVRLGVNLIHIESLKMF